MRFSLLSALLFIWLPCAAIAQGDEHPNVMLHPEGNPPPPPGRYQPGTSRNFLDIWQALHPNGEKDVADVVPKSKDANNQNAGGGLGKVGGVAPDPATAPEPDNVAPLSDGQANDAASDNTQPADAGGIGKVGGAATNNGGSETSELAHPDGTLKTSKTPADKNAPEDSVVPAGGIGGVGSSNNSDSTGSGGIGSVGTGDTKSSSSTKKK